jgi:hypothetical protein
VVCVKETDDLRVRITIKSLAVLRGKAHGDNVLRDITENEQKMGKWRKKREGETIDPQNKE